MVKNWIKVFLYQIKNNKFFTALNVFGLSLGIAGLIFSILYWNEEHSYNAWNPEKEHTFGIVSDLGEGMVWSTSTAVLADYFQKSIPEIESYCYIDNYYQEGIVVYKGKKTLTDKIQEVQTNYFDFFPFQMIKGNSKTAIGPGTIAISDELATKIFGSEDPMGKVVFYGDKNFTVRGVYHVPGKSTFEPMILTNQIERRISENKGENDWGNYSYGLFIKLKDVSKKEVVAKKIERIYYENRTLKYAQQSGISPEEYIKKYGRTKIILQQLKTLRLSSIVDDFPGGRVNIQLLLIMVFLSVLILLLSIVNYINLATANAVKRAKEVGVRKIIGASKSNIIAQFVFETVLLTLLSILLALVIVELSLPYYNDFLNKNLVIHSNEFYLELIGIFIGVVLLAGFFPAVYVSNFETLKVLKGNFGRSKSGVWLRNGMLVFQFAIASFFTIGSYIVYEQVHFMSTKDLGFNGRQVIEIKYRNPYDFRIKGFEKKVAQRYDLIKQEIAKMKGVKNIAAGAFDFGKGSNSSSGYAYHDIQVQSQNMGIDFELLDMMKIKMTKGRNLSPKFSADTINSILINEAASRMMNEKNPIGKEIDWNDKKLKIVGVVSDFHINGLETKIQPMTFFHFKTISWMIQNVHAIYVTIDPQEIEKTMPEIEKFWLKNIDPDYPFEYDFVDKNFARTYASYENMRNLFSLLNVVVILIALFGLFALASYSIERRMKEIAIRKTLGAETKVLLKSLSKQYLIFCVVGFVFALFPVYYLLNKWLENFAYRISISWIPFTIGFIILMILTLTVVLSRAYQATKVDVLKYLKYE